MLQLPNLLYNDMNLFRRSYSFNNLYFYFETCFLGKSIGRAMHFLKNRRFIQSLMRLCSIICAVLIFFLSSQSKLPTLSEPIFGLDKLLHAFAFGSLAFTSSYWLSDRSWKEKPFLLFFLVVGIVALYGASDEFHQSFVPNRSVSVYDWIADCVGAVLAVLLRLWIVRKTKEN